MKRGREESAGIETIRRCSREGAIGGEGGARDDADSSSRSGRNDAAARRTEKDDRSPPPAPAPASSPSPLDSLPETLLFRVLFTLSDDARSMGRFVASYGRLWTLAGMPPPPDDAPEEVVDKWDGGCHELRRGAGNLLTGVEGYEDLAPELRENAMRSFSGALWQLHQLRKIRSEGPSEVVDEIERIDFTVAPVVVPGTGTVLLGSKEREEAFRGTVAQWNVESGVAEQRFRLETGSFVASLAVAGGHVYVGRSSGDGTIHVWNLATWAREGRKDLVGHQECAVCALHVVRRETLISVGCGEHGVPSVPEIKVWNLTTNECTHSFRNIDHHWEPFIAISADYNTLVCASEQSRRIDTWDVSTSYANTTRTEINLPANFNGVDALATSEFSASAHPGGYLACAHHTISSGAVVAKPLSKCTITLWSFSSTVSLLRTFDHIAGFDVMHWPCPLLWCGKVLIAGTDSVIFKMKGMEKLDRCDSRNSRKVAQEELKFVPLMHKGELIMLLPGIDDFALVGGTVIATHTDCSEIIMLE
mmetsp:Transcript_62560/g.185024  ORF Transcript_62560/g.185024 Transcript_62560/m.185024 type:complete len:533 (-) Transcript_62560:142-1740(-)